MKTILILGAGKSSSYLIDYLAESCNDGNRKLILGDLDLALANSKLQGKPNTEAKQFSIEDKEELKDLIKVSDVVISMLPAFMHPIVAQECLNFEKHFFSASYESEELKSMKSEIEAKGLFFLNECGLDPGLDHMSAMKIILEAKANEEELLSFKSYCGGLLAPTSEDNPWKYKFTWNPRNVVLAGQGTSRYIENGELKFVPYHQVFKRTETIHFDRLGDFDGYPNRDSLNYRKVYGIENIQTMLRGTLRRSGYCKAWDVFVQLGLTDDSYQLVLKEGSTLRQFLNTFLPYKKNLSIEEKLAEAVPEMDFPTFEKIQWLGFFGNRKLPKSQGSPASILQAILEEDWKLFPEDKDMILMQHQFEIISKEGIKSVNSSLVCFGEDSTYTAMAKTVGLPLAIAVDEFLKGNIKLTGLHIPVSPELFNPILSKLKTLGIRFVESAN